MYTMEIFNKLYVQIDHLLVSSREYHSKYYLKKKIHTVLPGIPEEKIYNAIELSWKNLKQPSKKELINEIITHLNA